MQASIASAIDPIEFNDEKQEKQYLKLIQKLRCLVCQNQNLSDSNADLAKDMRLIVARQIKAGRDNDSIIKFMVNRYGYFILYKPPLNLATLVLWLSPFVLVIISIGLLIFWRQDKTPLILSEQERAIARQLLDKR